MPQAERSIGYYAQVACTWEVLARKAGNVCPGREYPDLTVNDFLASAAAIAPILEKAPDRPVGATVLAAIEATRKVVSTNTNLGIVLLLAPLASIPLDQPLQPALGIRLRGMTVEDSCNLFAAIRLAKPSGLGEAPKQDVRTEPTLPLRDIMVLTKGDRIAEQYKNDFKPVLEWFVPLLIRCVRQRNNIERAIVETQLQLLSGYQDTHILRKHGIREAMKVRDAAQDVLHLGGLDTPAGQQAFLDFDEWLRADNHARNPGTTADLLAACLFVALRQEAIAPAVPFVWNEHPFASC
jgi:triphosphoribosyl-dephospho-CoA synthase